jgi:mannitol 2-dehydrogenase
MPEASSKAAAPLSAEAALVRPSLKTLPHIANATVPAYDRASLSPGIVHIGVGNFHRAHMAHYLHRLFEMGLDHDWAIIGGGVKPFDATMRAKLAPQDWLTTVVELDPERMTADVTGAMIDFVETTPVALCAALENPAIRIVSLTITEGGYFVDALTGGFDAAHPDIVADAANPDAPATVFGVMLKALRTRRSAGLAPFTVLSCDNLPENGHVAKAAVTGLAALQDAEFGDWVAANVAFPNTMVDCITPATGPREIALVEDMFGMADAAPVTCEPFRQWVLEDNFPQGRPAFEKVGAEFVTDVAPYELMKLRILNAGHAAIAYPAGLLRIHYVHEAMAHPLVRGFLDWLLINELIPTVPAIPGVSFADYHATIVKRFSNSAVADTIPRLCLDGSNRQPKFILPAVRDRLAAGLSVDGLAMEVALWCRFCAALGVDGKPLAVPDDNAESLTRHALAARSRPAAFLEQQSIFGNLADAPRFSEAFGAALDRLWTAGVETTLADICQGAFATA